MEGREGRRREGGKSGDGSGPDQVREEIDVRVHRSTVYITSNIKTIGLLPACYNVCHCQRHLKLTNYFGTAPLPPLGHGPD